MKKTILLFLLFYHISNGQTFDWAKLTATSGNVIADTTGNIFVGGVFSGSQDFDTGPGTMNLTSYGGVDIYISKFDTLGNFLWAKQIGGINQDYGWFKLDKAGNIYVYGYFYGTADFDPGVGTFNMTTSGSSQAFILKLDSNGNLIWAQKIGGANCASGSISLDDQSNVYIFGGFTGTNDFDQGPGIANLTSSSGGVNYIVKLFADGTFAWAENFGGSSGGTAIDMSYSNGNLYLLARFTGTIDGQPGSGVFNLTSAGNFDVFISKIDTSGNFIWAKNFGGSDNDYPTSLVITATESIYTTGYFSQTADFDPGAGIFDLSATLPLGISDIFVSKLDFNGNFVWAKRMGGNSNDYSSEIKTDQFDNAYMIGTFSDTADFDPGLGFLNMISNNGPTCIVKLDSNGNLIWAKQTGSSIGGTTNPSVFVDQTTDIFVADSYNGTLDFDPGSGVYDITSTGGTGFLLKLGQDICSNMAISIDSARNITCSAQGFASANILNGTPPFIYLWTSSSTDTSSAISILANGIYGITISDANTCTRNTSVLIGGPLSISGFDLQANMVSNDFRPSTTSFVTLDAFNDGCIPATGSLKFVLDNLISLDTTYALPDSISGDTLIWFFNNLTFDSVHLTPSFNLLTSSLALTNDTICFTIIINPILGDTDPINNTKKYCFPVINSWDPNVKMVYPPGVCDQNFVSKNQLLTYSVQFQNTGNAEALNIFIIDTLDSDLDINTIRVIGSSHPVITEVLPGNVLKFRFNNIHLPDSTANEILSHGYVIYEVKPNAIATSGAEIDNTANIYFDYNPAVITNSVMNSLIDTVPTDCASVEVNTIKNQKQLFYVYPNPANNTITIETSAPTQLKIMNILGEVVIERKIKAKEIIDISDLNNGIYFIQVADGYSTKLIKQ